MPVAGMPTQPATSVAAPCTTHWPMMRELVVSSALIVYMLLVAHINQFLSTLEQFVNADSDTALSLIRSHFVVVSRHPGHNLFCYYIKLVKKDILLLYVAVVALI